MAAYNVITKSQLEKIKQKVAIPTVDDATKDRQRLKDLSDDRAERWPNTLQAQRARKERARLERLAAEEAERQEVDRHEEELRAEQRRIQIERANKILFDESDKVKALHGSVLMSDVLKENETLVEYKKQIEALKKAQEQAYVEQQRQYIELLENTELAKMEEARQRALQQKDIQMKQLEDLKGRILAERMENKRDGELIKAKAAAERAEQERAEIENRERALALNMETRKANEVLQRLKMKDAEMQAEAERAIEEYSRQKAATLAERERRAAEKRAAKAAERQRLIDIMEKNYLEEKAKMEARLAASIRAAEEKQNNDEAERLRRLRAELDAIDASRQAQLRMRGEQRHRDRVEGEEFRKAWEVRLEELREEEAREIREARERARAVLSFQQRQADLKSRRKAAASMEEMQAAAQIELSLKDQEETFQRYAEVVMEEVALQGKSIKPIQLHLAKKQSFGTTRAF